VLDIAADEFEYLKIQRGDLDHLSNDLPVWQWAYQKKLASTLQMMEPFLPERCRSILDVGSGLGGIDIFLYDFYIKKGEYPSIHLIDGEQFEPKVIRHDRPFNSMSVALTFLKRNGVKTVTYSTPNRFARVGSFDLVVSFAAWCFHIAPSAYLDFVLRHCHKHTVLILDVRRNYWRYELMDLFNLRTTLEVGKKYDRLVLSVK